MENENQDLTFSIPGKEIFKAGQAGIREADWRKKLAKVGGRKIRDLNGGLECRLPAHRLDEAIPEIENFAERNLFPMAVVFHIPSKCLIELDLGSIQFCFKR